MESLPAPLRPTTSTTTEGANAAYYKYNLAALGSVVVISWHFHQKYSLGWDGSRGGGGGRIFLGKETHGVGEEEEEQESV
jgi:hypothetical protein